MEIFIDADACPVVAIAERVAKERNLPVTLLCDTNHVLTSNYSQVVVIGAGSNAVDFALVNRIHAGDLCITQDYGVATMVLGKKAYAIHQSGMQYTNENMDSLLMSRYVAKKVRDSGQHTKGPSKRKPSDDVHFEEALRALLDAIERSPL